MSQTCEDMWQSDKKRQTTEKKSHKPVKKGHRNSQTSEKIHKVWKTS